MPSLTERSLAMADVHEGGCLCGALRYRTIGEPMRVAVCHCTWCQRRTGSAFAVEPAFLKEQVKIAQGTPRRFRQVSPAHGRWLELHFCETCGANIGLTVERATDTFLVDAGTYDDPSWIDAGKHAFRYVFMGTAQAWSQPPEGADLHEAHYR
jgi:hypothetical protein